MGHAGCKEVAPPLWLGGWNFLTRNRRELLNLENGKSGLIMPSVLSSSFCAGRSGVPLSVCICVWHVQISLYCIEMGVSFPGKEGQMELCSSKSTCSMSIVDHWGVQFVWESMFALY